jgi:OFA family oxalate/formate antiporter-like MFS transporter
MVVVACVCGLLLVVSKTRYHALTTRAPASDPGHSRAVGFLWGGYGLGAAAGLMAIGHATGIAKASGALPAQLVLGVMLIGIGNALGGVFAGLLADRYSPLKMISTIPIISAASLGLLLLSSVAAITLVALAICGFAYGALIAAYPITVSEFAGKHDAARIYGRVFTAWGLSGLLAPWIAGVLFDWQSDYRFALGIATATAIASCWLATRAAILIRSK